MNAAPLLRRLVAYAAIGAALVLCAPAASGASPSTIASIKLSPQAVTLPNPATAGGSGKAERIAVSLGVFRAGGAPIRSGKFARPITLTVYGPSPGVLRAETPRIGSPVSKVYFDYSGGSLANPIVVSAVSGGAFALMSFQPAHPGPAGKSSVTFRMPNASANMANGFGFSVSVGGGRVRHMEMDTGSRGVVVPVSALGPHAVGPGPPGSIEYSSDGKIDGRGV